MKVLQRNCAAYLKLRNWQWWRLFTKVSALPPPLPGGPQPWLFTLEPPHLGKEVVTSGRGMEGFNSDLACWRFSGPRRPRPLVHRL